MNVQITIKKASYPKSDFRSAGTGLTSTITKGGHNQSLVTGLNRNGVLADEVDSAVKRLIESMVLNEEVNADVTIDLPTGYTLSAAFQQHYVDKYTIEPEINSITFA